MHALHHNHRIGTAELESALSAHPQCAEAAIVRCALGGCWVQRGQGPHPLTHLCSTPPPPPPPPLHSTSHSPHQPTPQPQTQTPTPTPTPSIPHPVKGESVYSFVVLMEGATAGEGVRKQLLELVRAQIGAFAVPDAIHWCVRCGGVGAPAVCALVLKTVLVPGCVLKPFCCCS